MKDWGLLEHLFCHHLGSFKSGEFVLLARVGRFIPCTGNSKRRDRKRSEQHMGDFLVLFPGAWGLLGPGALQEPALLQHKLSQNVCSLWEGPGAAGSGRSPKCHRGWPQPRLGCTHGSQRRLCPSPGPAQHLGGPGQQMRVLRCHRERWLVRGTSWRQALGSVRDRWLCQIWLPEIVQDTLHLAGLQRPGLQGGLGAGSVWPPRRATHASVTGGPVGGPGS